MRQNNTKQMLDYWMDLFWNAGNDHLRRDELSEQSIGKLNWPERSDIQPANCRSLLGNMFILERDGSQINYRLAGTSLCNMYGRELKRETFAEAFAGVDQRSIDSWIKQLGHDEHLVLICSVAETERGNRIDLETLLLPINHHGERGSRILGITTATDQPYWLGARPLIVQTIRSIRVLRPWESAKTSLATPVFPQAPVDHEPISTSTNQRRLLEAPGIYDALKDIAEIDSVEETPRRRVAHLTIIDGDLS